MIDLKTLKGNIHIHEEIRRQGHHIATNDNILTSDNDIVVQAIIDSFDPLPSAKTEAIDLVNEEAGNTRVRYVTPIPSQDITYQMKLEDAKLFKADLYPEINIANYPFINAEAQALKSTGQVAADLILGTALQWTQLAAYIEQVRRTAAEDIKNEIDWNQCKVIADKAIAILKGI